MTTNHTPPELLVLSDSSSVNMAATLRNVVARVFAQQQDSGNYKARTFADTQNQRLGFRGEEVVTAENPFAALDQDIQLLLEKLHGCYPDAKYRHMPPQDVPDRRNVLALRGIILPISPVLRLADILPRLDERDPFLSISRGITAEHVSIVQITTQVGIQQLSGAVSRTDAYESLATVFTPPSARQAIVEVLLQLV